MGSGESQHEEQVHEQESAAAEAAHHIGKAPYVPQSDRNADPGEESCEVGAEDLSVGQRMGSFWGLRVGESGSRKI